MTKTQNPCPVCGQETAGLGISRFDKELDACPFCGSEYTQMFLAPAEFGVHFIAGCTECGARTRECMSHTDAIELWNRRAQS